MYIYKYILLIVLCVDYFIDVDIYIVYGNYQCAT